MLEHQSDFDAYLQFSFSYGLELLNVGGKVNPETTVMLSTLCDCKKIKTQKQFGTGQLSQMP